MHPSLEGLEDRLLLYATLGGQWTYGSRITYSFMPDGTNVGGTPSVLFQTLNAKFATATWQQQFEAAAAIWEGATNINLALVSDGGQDVGTSGNQQDDSRFGDIRIGAIPLPSGVLAETFLPPPINGGTDAGDIIFNSTVNWQINSGYDLWTVAAHELGHSLGLADVSQSQFSTDVMYGTYSGIKQSLAVDDIAGIQSLYGTRLFDAFNINGHRNNFYTTATNITSYIDGNAQIALPGLDNTTTSDNEWYQVTVPASTTGTMTVTVQSSNLSSLAPKFVVYNSALCIVNQAAAVNTYGATISTSTSVSANQVYYIKVLGVSGPGSIGGYGLLVNFGNHTQPPIAPPNTVVAAQPDQGGGSVNNGKNAGGGSPTGQNGELSPIEGAWLSLGGLAAWIDPLTVSTAPGPVFPGPTAGTPDPSGGSQSEPTSTPTEAPVTSPIMVNTVSTPGAGQAIPTPPVGPLSPIIQAVDDALGSWSHHHHKARPLHHHHRGRI
jgi:hypothetical protein